MSAFNTALRHPAVKYVTQFDSCTSMLYALGHVLRNESFKGVGVVPTQLEFVPPLLNHLPFPIRQQIYRYSGGWAASAPEKLGAIDAEEIADWVVRQYPGRKKFPAVLIGSSNGAMTHLAAALGVPWLPQTFLVAVRRRLHPDEMEADVEWGRRAARLVREKNPQLRICQMHDPVQDRLMIAKMGYFRIKRLNLGPVYERFLRQRLEPGGTVLIIDNTLSWPVMQAGPEHTFQIGGLGALKPEEYLHGSPRVRAFLRACGSSRKSWPLPGKPFRAPESEWGFHPPLDADCARFAKAHGFRLRRAAFRDPEDASFFTAELYRWWYRQNGLPQKRLFVECFALLEPGVALETGSIPFWLAFNTEPSWRSVRSYLGRRAFDEIYLMLMSNGLEGIGQVSIGRWKSVLERARARGEFLGVDEAKYPMDFASFVRYQADVKKKMPRSPEKPPPLSLKQLDRFIRLSGTPRKVKFF